jgi:cbb3-type cytochrome oxidase subunit 3
MHMPQAVLSHWDQPLYPIIALGLFLVSFAIYFYWTMKKSNKNYYEKSSYIVLEDGVKHER